MTSPFLRPAHMAAVLDFPSAKAFWSWVNREHVPYVERKHIKLFDRDAVVGMFTHARTGQPAKMPKVTTQRYAPIAAGASALTTPRGATS